MKKGALFLNHTIMGGAEKSAKEQLANFKDDSVDVFYPKVSGDEESLDKEFDLKSVRNISTFNFPKAFNKLSRSGGNNYISGALSYLFSLVSILKLPLKTYDFIWLNGLKVFVFILPVLCLLSYKGKVYFHLRDYLKNNFFINFCIKLANLFNVKLEFIANSSSVKRDFIKEFSVASERVHVCYNICEMSPIVSDAGSFKTIGLCSMLTPWKGVHTIILFSSLFKKELKKIGVGKIKIFGGAIYSTSGEHNSYHKEIERLCNKLDNDLIEFMGRKPAKEIYASIDMLIHSSIEPEPFGRIIMEGFGAQIPVLSTGIGGSAEILKGFEESCYDKYDYQGLFNKIEDLFTNQSSYEDLIAKQNKRYEEINKLAKTKIVDVFYGEQ